MELYGIYTLDEVEEIALKFSEDNDIVESNEWANQIPEFGIGGGSQAGENHPCRGVPKSEEHKEKIRQKSLLQRHSEETKQKMRKPKERISCINCRNEISKSNFERHYNACIKPKPIKNGTAGKYNPRAKTIKIFDNTNNLQYLCEGTFVETCKEKSLPYTHFTKSYKENGTSLYYETTSAQLTKLIKSGNIKYKGWYALIID